MSNPAARHYNAFSADGHTARWATWDGTGEETTTLLWENEGWTVSGQVSREQLQYVLRLSPTWQVRQFLLFRDLDEPDLWLATDGGGRWGEMNGAHRTELDGCYDIALACTPFTATLPIRRLPLLDGHTAEIPVVTVDPETLAVLPVIHRYTRLSFTTWRCEQSGGIGGIGGGEGGSGEVEFEVDEHGLVRDYPGRFRRVG